MVQCEYCKEEGAPNDTYLHPACKELRWGTPQTWGKLIIRYKPTGEIKELELGIKRMPYHNELIFCESWGYDEGRARLLNNPDNWEVLYVRPRES
jgi:hypothetical protein